MVDRPSRDTVLRVAYLLPVLALMAAYPALAETGRTVAFLVVSSGAIPALVVGLLRITPGRRLPWWLLLAALVTLNAGNWCGLLSGGAAVIASNLFDATATVLSLAAALALVVRQGRNNLGVVIDTTIVALALGGLLWDLVLSPYLASLYDSTEARADLFIAVFSLCGVLGALTTLVQTAVKPATALWLLITSVLFGLAGYVVLAVATTAWQNVAATLMFMAAYATIGLFGLEPTAQQLARPAPTLREDTLSVRRLVFLGLAVAVIPVVVGGDALADADADGLLLVIGGAAIAVLVMLRIGNLSAERDRAERALRHEATHDHLTGLPNRRELVEQLGRELSQAPSCVILFCDLDGFKSINDRLGHNAGDQILIEVAQRLRSCVRPSDLVSRFGGDEFLILFRGMPLREVQPAGTCIVDALSQPILLPMEKVRIGASIGIAEAAGGIDPEELIRRADHAMYSAKKDEPAQPGTRIVAVTVG